MNLIQGVGCNDVDFPVSFTVEGKKKILPEYRCWSDMLRRCYSNLSKKDQTYKGCRVDSHWWLFSKFYFWMQEQPYEGLHLDKDIIQKDNKVYSESFCVFVPQYINSLLTQRQNFRGSLPLGVTYIKKTKDMKNEMHNCYKARVNDGSGKRLELGNFDSEIAAHRAWQRAKIDVIENQIARYSKEDFCDSRVVSGLYSRVEILHRDLINSQITLSL